MNYDAVWTVNHHPSLCGTAKFSHQLAQRLGLPVLRWGAHCDYPLISVRASELMVPAVDVLCSLPATFDVFWHDYDGAKFRDYLTAHAERVYAANVTIAEQIRPIRPDVIEAWCPSTIQGNPHRGTINVLTFGMAHKIQTERYGKLKALLDATGEDYTVSVSTAIHEGSPWDETARVGDRLRTIFADRLRVLGYLADDALCRELRDCSAVALFFEPALRSNNTTFWAAHASRKPVVTNVDEHSPQLDGTVCDIDSLTSWPSEPLKFWPVCGASWDALLVKIRTGKSVVSPEEYARTCY